MNDIEMLIAKYDRNVPRYTSYPTANHFQEAHSVGGHEAWLGALPAAQPLSLYLHIPFCKALCRYCGCHTRVIGRYDPAAAYTGTLIREIERLAGHLGAKRSIAHIHWGGGTPTFLIDDDIAAIFDTLRAQFSLAPDCEIAMEIDPRTLDAGRAAFLAGQGVNRVSLGVQDFDPEVQAAIGRLQPFETVARTVDSLRSAGIAAINFDLIYGLPNQNEDSIRRTMAQAVALSPDRLAVFGYAHVPWFKPQQKILERYDIPGAARRYAMAALTTALLTQSGYVTVGIDHFARADDPLVRAMTQRTLRRNFQGYTTDSCAALLGLGASSISALPQGYLQNDPNIEAYRGAVDQGRFAHARALALTDEDRLRAAVIEELMCFLDGNLSGLPAPVREDAAAKLEECVQDGLAIWDGSRLRITERGRPFARAICTAFDAYYSHAQTRHAKAV